MEALVMFSVETLVKVNARSTTFPKLANGKYNPFTVTSHFSEALLKLYFYRIFLRLVQTKLNLPDFFSCGNLVGRCCWSAVFSGIFSFPRPYIPALLHCHFASPPSVIKIPMLRLAQTSPRIDKTFIRRRRGKDRCAKYACSPPTKTIRVHSPAGSLRIFVPDDAVGRLVFSGISRFPALSFRRCSILISITLVGSQASMLRAVQISSLTHSLLPHPRAPVWRELEFMVEQTWSDNPVAHFRASLSKLCKSQCILKKYRSGSTGNAKCPGRPRVISQSETGHLVREVAKKKPESVQRNWWITLLQHLDRWSHLGQLGIVPMKQTYKGRAARKKPFISEINRK
ncbi:hypothetical protein PR048_021935 [Dryococelus australis]|uniref:Uncharacterized protein n=1 Tax=Dryococelus australis TaxID=614101 RepID=A0ABQ9GZP1_9NEOP|nr:hypothetical protein PR048_021935 [Dryococelus australis]